MMQQSRRNFILAGICTSFLLPPLFTAGAATPKITRVVANKVGRTIQFFDNHGHSYLFDAAFGTNPLAKQREGDWATPEGDYKLWPARRSASWRWFLPIDYPNDADRERGKRDGIALNQLGSAIGLHGVGDVPPMVNNPLAKDWTAGCIAVTNEAIDQISRWITQPVPIQIHA